MKKVWVGAGRRPAFMTQSFRCAHGYIYTYEETHLTSRESSGAKRTRFYKITRSVHNPRWLGSQTPRKRSGHDFIKSHVVCTNLVGWGRRPLLYPHHHRIRADKALDVGLLEPGVPQPPLAIGARVIEPASGLYEHVETHEQPEGVVPPLVVN